MIKVVIPRNHSRARKWIVGQILDRITSDYVIEERQSTNWEILWADGTLLWLFEDNIIPNVYVSSNCEMELYQSSEKNEQRQNLIAFRAKTKHFKKYSSLQSAGGKLLPDLFGMAFWLMGRVEEYGTHVPKDDLGRFSAKDSFAYKAGFILRPVVDEWTAWLRYKIIKRFPDFPLVNNEFSVDISHDVDVPFLFLNQNLMRVGRRMAGDLLKRKSVSMFLSRPIQFLLTKTLGVRFSPS